MTKDTTPQRPAGEPERTPEACCQHARELAGAGQFQRALQAYAQALQIDPGHDPAWIGQGRLQVLQGDLPTGVQSLREGLQRRLQRPSHRAAPPVLQDFDRPEVTACFWRTLARLAQAGVHAFPTAGTLLGLEREGRLLPHDKDVDLALPLQEQGEAVALLSAWGWQPVRSPLGLCNPVGLWHPVAKLHMDLCALMKDEATGQTMGGFWRRDWPREWWRIVDYPGGMNLRQIAAPAGSVWYPMDPVRILQAFYGEGWRVPDPDFDTTIAGFNMRGFSMLSQCYALYRTYGRWEEGKLSRALATARHAQRKQPDDPLWVDIVAHLAEAV